MLPRTQWTKIRWFNCFLLYCMQFEKDDYIKNLHDLSCSVLLKSNFFSLMCVLDLFSECWQSTLFQIFCFVQCKDKNFHCQENKQATTKTTKDSKEHSSVPVLLTDMTRAYKKKIRLNKNDKTKREREGERERDRDAYI